MIAIRHRLTRIRQYLDHVPVLSTQLLVAVLPGPGSVSRCRHLAPLSRYLCHRPRRMCHSYCWSCQTPVSHLRPFLRQRTLQRKSSDGKSIQQGQKASSRGINSKDAKSIERLISDIIQLISGHISPMFGSSAQQNAHRVATLSNHQTIRSSDQ